MGPRLVSRGKTETENDTSALSSLQWGRDLLVAESCPRSSCMTWQWMLLQWGRDLLVAERPCPTDAEDGVEILLQWGRDLLVAESSPSQLLLPLVFAISFARTPVEYSYISHLSNPLSIRNTRLSLRISYPRAPLGISLPPNHSHGPTNASQTPGIWLSRLSKAELTTESGSQSIDDN